MSSLAVESCIEHVLQELLVVEHALFMNDNMQILYNNANNGCHQEMASYSSILRKNKPLNNLNRGLKKDDSPQNGVLIEKIYCDRAKGRTSSRLVDSSATPKDETENANSSSVNSNLTETTDMNKENVDARNPKIVQTLETTHTLVTNSTGLYYLQTKKETQSIIDDLEEFPILGTNKPTKRIEDSNQSSELSPYAKPFVLTKSFDGNSIYNAYRYYAFNEGPDEYNGNTYDDEFYADNLNEDYEESWTEKEHEQLEPVAQDTEYDIAENSGDSNCGTSSLSRKKYLSNLSADAKPFEFKKSIPNKNDASERNSATYSLNAFPRTYSKPITIDSAPFVPSNNKQSSLKADNCHLEDNSDKDEKKSFETKKVSIEDRIKINTFKSQFEQQSRTFGFDRKVVGQIFDNEIDLRPTYMSSRYDKINKSDDFNLDSTDSHEKFGSSSSSLLVEAEPFTIRNSQQNNSVSNYRVGKITEVEGTSDKKKYPLIPLPSNSAKTTVAQPTNLRLDAKPFSITQSKVEKHYDYFENRNPNSIEYKRDSRPTKITTGAVQSSSSPSKSLKDSNSPSRNNNNRMQNSGASKCTENGASNNIVSWRRGALSKLVLNSLDDTSQQDSSEHKKDKKSFINRNSAESIEYDCQRNLKISPERAQFNSTKKYEGDNKQNFINSKAKQNYTDEPRLPYTQHWSNGVESPTSPGTSNNSSRRMSSENSRHDDAYRRSCLSESLSEQPSSTREKTSIPSFAKSDSSMNIDMQQKEYFKLNVDSEGGSMNTPQYIDKSMMNNFSASNCTAELKSPIFPPLPGPYPTFNRLPSPQPINSLNQFPAGLSSNANVGYYNSQIGPTQGIHGAFQTHLGMRNINEEINRMHIPPVNQYFGNPPFMNNTLIQHPRNYAPINILPTLPNQPPRHDINGWNLRHHNSQLHSQQMTPYMQSLNCGLPNSFNNSAPLPNSTRHFEPQMMRYNPLPIHQNMGNSLPNEYFYQNPSSVQNTKFIEANAFANNGVNTNQTRWAPNYAKDFNAFLDRYALKLTSQMLPTIQANQPILANSQNSQDYVNLKNAEVNSPKYDYEEHRLISNTGFNHTDLLENKDIAAINAVEKNSTKMTNLRENNFKDTIEVLQKENTSLLIPPPVPPRRNINVNNGKNLSQFAFPNALPVHSSNSKYMSDDNGIKATELFRTNEAKKLIPKSLETETNEMDSEKIFWPSMNTSLKNVIHTNKSVSTNPFLTDFIPALHAESLSNTQSSDLNPFRDEVNEVMVPLNNKPRGNNPFIDNEIEAETESNEIIIDPAGVEEPFIKMPKDPFWFYLDPQNKIQGPFASIEMAEWLHMGYFKDQVKIRRNCDKRFIDVGEFIKLTGNNSPFLASQSIPPLESEAIISGKSTNPFSDAWQSNLSQKQCDLYNS